VFWPAGFTMSILSTKTDPNNSDHECLDVFSNNENAGATLDDSDCNGTNAQWFILDLSHRVELANDTSLCLSIVGTETGGTYAVELEDCSGSSDQEWYMGNKGVNSGCDDGDCSVTEYATFVNFASACLDIDGNSSTSGTTVDDHTCNNTTAQLWVPAMYFSDQAPF
jgi:hypothetical protein